MRVSAGALGLLLMIASTSPAVAGNAAWGCQGRIGPQQVIFNRYSMFVFDSKKPFGDLKLLLKDDINELVKDGDSVKYETRDENDTLVKKIEFTPTDNQGGTITLTERSSRKLAHRGQLICGREESTAVTRKVYWLKRESKPARTISMSCIEYLLTTHGGRPCVSGPLNSQINR